MRKLLILNLASRQGLEEERKEEAGQGQEL